MLRSTIRRPRAAIVRHGDYTQPHPRRDLLALRDAGFEVDFICNSEEGKPHFERIDGITIIRVPLLHKRGGLPRYLFEYAAMPLLSAGALAFRSLGGRYKYVEVDTMPTWLLAATVVPKLLGAKSILYMFEHMADLMASDKGLTADHPLIRTMDGVEMLCIRAADVVLTPYEKNREQYIGRGISADKIKFIPNCPNENVFLNNVDPAKIRRLCPAAVSLGHDSPAQDTNGQKQSPENNRATWETRDGFRLVTHTSLLERYGIQILIRSLAQLRERIPGITLDIIGLGEYEPVLKDLALSLNVDDITRFHGPVEFVNIAGMLLDADIGVGPYLLDLLPNKIMEYLLLGIPAIATDWPTMRRYFGDDAVRYARSNDVEALSDTIEDMYRHPRESQKQAAIAQEQFLNTLAWRRSKHDYLSVYGVEDQHVEKEAVLAHDQPANNWLSFVLRQSRGPRNAATRLPTILSRFGVTPGKSLKHFETLLSVTDRYSVTPTLPVTAMTARRHPDVVRWLASRGVEVAAHGYVHNDYKAISANQQLEHVRRAREELFALGFEVQGWRCPYSRWNQDTLVALNENGFQYDATPVYEWPAFDQEGIVMNDGARADYQRLCNLYGVRDASKCAVLPQTVDGLVQIPMSIPQDEDMVDRLHLDSDLMSRVWLRVLKESHQVGESFVICLHPERAGLCREPLDATLAEARRLGNVWIAPLLDIADWWKERARATVKVEHDGKAETWRIITDASTRTLVTHGDQRLEGVGSLEVRTELKPVVYAGPEWSDLTRERVAEAGYVVESNGRAPSDYTVRLSDRFKPSDDPEEVIRWLGSQEDRLVRLQPWPVRYKSCLSVTGDIDALTLIDFAFRLKEFS